MRVGQRASIALVLSVMLTGCAHGVLGPIPAVDPTQAAEIVIIRPTGFVGCGTSLPVTLDGQDAYGVACGEHVILVVAPGERIIGDKHWPWFVTDENTTAVTVVAQQRYYFRLDVGAVLNRVTPTVGERLITETERLSDQK
jgi:hypothetical protein